ncbi:hypothetical protein Syun_000372 [Stephania yunnanensis]|uniref:acetyl-CoA carboxytransferase n=1 Tax=Stephania yunnanensis TaxID=152371 RepID=A0AAP0Q5A0_9MAGN
MASVPHSAVALSATSSASDLLRSSRNGFSGVPLRALGRARLDGIKRHFSVVAKIRKGKKHEYPWPDDADPNVKGGVLSHLSYFKPLKERPKPVTLDFEKPLMDLEKKIIDVRRMAQETGLDFSDQINSLENKYHQALKDLYTHLTPIQRVNTARHPNRPTFLDHVLNITEKFVELHGDRQGYDDPAIVTGIGTIDGRPYMFMGHQKGRNTKENIQRNFGMPTPHGYRKAMRMMYYADHHGFPIISFVDTPGAFADLKSEELGQGEAIAHNLRTMFGLKVPIVSVVIGEGGSGGALAIACANKLFMLENAVFYVASPEACAAILWKTAKASPKAAEKLKITATELLKLKVSDGIIPVPLQHSGLQNRNLLVVHIPIQLGRPVTSNPELLKMDTPTLLEHRRLKFRKLGGFQEGLPVPPEKKVNMKKKDEPVVQRAEISKTPDLELEDEVEKLKQQITKARESSPKPAKLGLNEMVDKLKREVDLEFSEAVRAVGLETKVKAVREELAKVNTSSQTIDQGLKDKIEKLTAEFDNSLSQAPNYSSLNSKLDMLKEMSQAKKLEEQNEKVTTLKEEINKKLNEVMEKSSIKAKIEALKAEAAAGNGASGQVDMREKIVKVKKEIELEFASALKSLNLDVQRIKSKTEDLVQTSFPDLDNKIEELDREIIEKIKDTVNTTDLKDKIELLKLEVAKAERKPDPELQSKIEALKEQIKRSLAEAVGSSKELVEKQERLKKEVVEATGTGAEYDASKLEVNVGATQGHSFS